MPLITTVSSSAEDYTADGTNREMFSTTLLNIALFLQLWLQKSGMMDHMNTGMSVLLVKRMMSLFPMTSSVLFQPMSMRRTPISPVYQPQFRLFPRFLPFLSPNIPKQERRHLENMCKHSWIWLGRMPTHREWGSRDSRPNAVMA